MSFIYYPEGVCSREILVDIEEGIIRKITFIGGCSGNQQGVSSLVEGLPLETVIQKLRGIRCGDRPTSCPDQLAKALERAMKDGGVQE